MDKDQTTNAILPSLVHCSFTTNDDKTPIGIISHLKLKRGCKKSSANHEVVLAQYVLFIDEIFTKFEFRRCGVAALLLHHVVGLEVYTACTFVDLLVDKTNHTVQAWYKKLGFRPLASYKTGDSGSDDQEVFSSIPPEKEHLRAVRNELEKELLNNFIKWKSQHIEFRTYGQGKAGRLDALSLLKLMNDERTLLGKHKHPLKASADLTICIFARPCQTHEGSSY